MASEGQVWRLVRGDELIGEIVIDEADWPWLHGGFAPTSAFSEVKSLFEREQELLEAEDFAAWETVYAQIARTMRLVSPDGPVAEFLLHVEHDRAWFRWSDEPFSEEV